MLLYGVAGRAGQVGEGLQRLQKVLLRIAAMPAAVLFPPVCPGCRRLVSQPGTLCPHCWGKLRFLERPWCDVLGTPFSVDPGPGAVSAAAIANPPPFDRARAAVIYTGVARELVQRLKFQDGTDLAPAMAGWMARAGAELIADAEFVVPVPLHRLRFLRRRFNQSAELARALSAQTSLAFAPEILERSKKTRHQVGLHANERAENVRAAFRVPVAEVARIKGRRLLLVDDVLTTGATVSSAARALKRAGAARVDVLTFARVPIGDFQPDE